MITKLEKKHNVDYLTLKGLEDLIKTKETNILQSKLKLKEDQKKIDELKQIKAYRERKEQ